MRWIFASLRLSLLWTLCTQKNCSKVNIFVYILATACRRIRKCIHYKHQELNLNANDSYTEMNWLI